MRGNIDKLSIYRRLSKEMWPWPINTGKEIKLMMTFDEESVDNKQIESLCKTCDKVEVCMYEATYRRHMVTLRELIPELETTPFSIRPLSCKYYWANYRAPVLRSKEE